MFVETHHERLEVTFQLPNGEGFSITTPLGYSTETNRYVTELLKELDRAGQAFLKSRECVGATKV